MKAPGPVATMPPLALVRVLVVPSPQVMTAVKLVGGAVVSPSVKVATVKVPLSMPSVKPVTGVWMAERVNGASATVKVVWPLALAPPTSRICTDSVPVISSA